MRAVVQDRFGGPEVMQVKELDVPKPGPGEVLVRTRAAGINPVDTKARAGLFPPVGAPPFVPGWDMAGVVEALGAGVTGFAVGDAVFGMPRFPKPAGAYAEYLTAPADEVALKPASLDFDAAGALPLAGLTAWHGLVDVAACKPGDRVLVYAAAGGVGHLAVQVAKARGASVAASASSGKLAYLRSMGADEVSDGGDAGVFDIVFDPIAGVHAEQALDRLRPGGILICLVNPSDAARARAEAEHKALHRIGVRPDGAALRALADLADAGKLRVAVAKAFPLAEAAKAHDFLDTRPIGKVVLTM